MAIEVPTIDFPPNIDDGFSLIESGGAFTDNGLGSSISSITGPTDGLITTFGMLIGFQDNEVRKNQ